MHKLFTWRIVRISTLVLLAAVLSWLSFMPASSAPEADQVVNNCSNDTELRNDLTAMQSGGGGTLTFNCGTATIVLTGGMLPMITTNTTINGGGIITISGNNAYRVFWVSSGGTLTLNDLTIIKASALDDGGAIYNAGTLNINASKFTENQSGASGYSGGAIRSDGLLNITGSEFANNKGDNGGALFLKWGNAVTNITNSNFHDNQTLSTASGWGGAILVFDGASATVSSTTFNANESKVGGALYVFGATSALTLTNTKLTSNRTVVAFSPGGTAGGINNEGTLVVSNSTFSGNTAAYGGGIRNLGNATLINSTLSSNPAVYEGGGIRNSGTLTLINSTLSGNSSFNGAGILNTSTANLTNVTLSGNAASVSGSGGGIDNEAGTANLTNVTLSRNSAGTGGGINRAAGTVNLINVLIAKGTSGANCAGIFGGSFSLSDDGFCNFGAGRDNVSNLLLGPLANNGGLTVTHMPLASSASVDNGTGSGCPATDQRGVTRPKGAACDVGAVERQTGEVTPLLYLPLIRR